VTGHSPLPQSKQEAAATAPQPSPAATASPQPGPAAVPPTAPGARAPPFQLRRFPAYLAAAAARLRAALAADEEAIAAAAAALARQRLDPASPWVRVEAPGPALPVVTVRRDAGELAGAVAFAFLRAGAGAPGLQEAVRAAAGEVGGWAEACGPERAAVAERVRDLERVEEGLARALGLADVPELKRTMRVPTHLRVPKLVFEQSRVRCWMAGGIWNQFWSVWV
jgi:hypothetical protein